MEFSAGFLSSHKNEQQSFLFWSVLVTKWVDDSAQHHIEDAYDQNDDANQCKSLHSEIVREDGVQCWAWNRIAFHPLSFIEFPFYNRFLSSLWEPALDSIAILFAKATSSKGQCGGGVSRNASVRCLDLLVAWSSSPKDLIVHGLLTFDHLIHRLHLWPYSALTVKPFIELILISTSNSQCLALFFPMLLLWHLESAA